MGEGCIQEVNIIGALTGMGAGMYERCFVVWQTAKCALASLLHAGDPAKPTLQAG